MICVADDENFRYFIKAMLLEETREIVWKDFYRGVLGYTFYESKELPFSFALFAGAPLKTKRRYYI